jgi:hypothetical protein
MNRQICPTDRNEGTYSDQGFTWQPGTWWVMIYADEACEYRLTSMHTQLDETLFVSPSSPPPPPAGQTFLIPPTIPQDMSWCDEYDINNSPTTTPGYICLPNDQVSWLGPSTTGLTRSDVVRCAALSRAATVLH